MKWSALGSLLQVFEPGGHRGGSGHKGGKQGPEHKERLHAKSEACAAPALINICLGHVRLAKEQQVCAF